MKFRCEREDLEKALSTAGRAVTTRGGALPVLAGIHLELQGDNLLATGTDLDLTIAVNTVVGGEEDGVAVLPSKLANDIVKAVPSGKIEVKIDGDEAQITAGRSEFSLRVIPADEFPRVAEPPESALELDAAAFRDSLKQVVPAASSDDSRPILTGVLMAAEEDGLRLVATDSYRLSVRDLPGTSVLSGDESVLVPSRSLSELSKVLDGDDTLTLRLGERDATFEIGSVRVSTRLIEGDFPNYRGLIPSSQPNNLIVNRAELLEAVRRVRLLAQEATPIRMIMKSSGLELVAVTQDVGQAHEAIDAKYTGEELTVAFNPEYLLNGLEVTTGDEVSLETVDALKPAVLRSVDNPEFLYLLMPVRVS